MKIIDVPVLVHSVLVEVLASSFFFFSVVVFSLESVVVLVLREGTRSTEYVYEFVVRDGPV